MPVRFGIKITHFGPHQPPDGVATAAREAEALGFDSVWATDHVIVPAEETSIPPHFYDPFVVMGVAAAATQRVEIGVSVLVVPYRDPVVCAKMLATLDQISGGRMILGAGVGWLEREFEALNVPFDQRGPICDEYLDVMHALWTTDPTTFDGRWRSFRAMRANPKPARAPFPVWVGGNAPPAIRRAARRGTGWHPINLTLDAFRSGVEAYREECRASGRPPGAICLRSMPARAEPTAGRLPFTGDPADVAADIDAFAAAGMTDVLFSPPVTGFDQLREEMHTIARDVRPLLADA